MVLSQAERTRRLQAGLAQGGDYRLPYEQDRDRLLYSLAFRRLGSITQVASTSEIRLLHNRLTHSEKVGQVGRRLTQYLMHKTPDFATELGLQPDLTETAGLAHDLGHPPFGHVAESELDALLKEQNFGSFEGNAQTFRTLTKTGFKKPTNDWNAGARLYGFDLTRASLAATLKYPASPAEALPAGPTIADRSRATKIGVYSTEVAEYNWAREGEAAGVLAPTAIIMDWSDDISYAVHDMEDHVRAGLIPFYQIHAEFEEASTPPKLASKSSVIRRTQERLQKKQIAYSEFEFFGALESLLAESKPLWGFKGTIIDDYRLQDWVTQLIVSFENAVTLSADPPYVNIAPDAIYRIEILKSMTWEYVIDAAPLAAAQEGQRRLIRQLFDCMCSWLKARPKTVPARLIDLHRLIRDAEAGFAPAGTAADEYVRARAVTDFLCSLTEPQTIDLFQRVTGVSPANVFGGWL